MFGGYILFWLFSFGISPVALLPQSCSISYVCSHRGCLTCFVLALTLLNPLEDTENHCHQKPGQFPWERKCLSLIRRVLAISTWPSTSHQEPTGLGGESLIVASGIGFAWPLLLCVHLPWEPWRKMVLAASHFHSFPRRGEPTIIQLLDTGFLFPVAMCLAWPNARPAQLPVHNSHKRFFRIQTTSSGPEMWTSNKGIQFLSL